MARHRRGRDARRELAALMAASGEPVTDVQVVDRVGIRGAETAARSSLQDAAGWQQVRSDRGCFSCGPAVGDGFAHLRGQRLGELRVGLSAE
jgi:hypothetical protein